MCRVSVIVPNFNHARFLDRRIRSILAQTYQDFELILLDDASTDGSREILERYRDGQRVRIVINESNSGSPFPQWNRGVELSRGEYRVIAEADDDAEPDLLERLVGALDAHPRAVLGYCQSWIIDDQDARLHDGRPWTARIDAKRWDRDFVVNGREEVSRFLALGNTIPNASAVVFRRADFIAAGCAPIHLRLAGDWLMWVRLALRGDILFVARPLNLFRQHSMSVRAGTSRLKELHENLEVVAEIVSSAGVAEDARRPLAAKMLLDWRSPYWHNAQPPAWGLVRRATALLWRIDRRSALNFFAFCAVRSALGEAGIAPARRVWNALKQLRRATPAD